MDPLYITYTPEVMAEIGNRPPFISIGDQVVASRLPNGYERFDQYANATGTVVAVAHNLNSMMGFRDTFSVEFQLNNTATTLPIYALELTRRSPDNQSSLDSGTNIFLSDIVRVTDPAHERVGRHGKVMAITRMSQDILTYVIEDQSVNDEMYALQSALKMEAELFISEHLPALLADEGLWLEYQATVEVLKEEEPNLTEFFIEMESKDNGLRGAYESQLKRTLADKFYSLPEIEVQTMASEAELQITADDSQIELIERYPPNTLFTD